MQKPLSILETSWRNQPTINVDEVRNIQFVVDPAPGSPVPVPGSLRGYVSDYPDVLICSMSDGSKRLITMSNGAPSGSYDSEHEVVDCPITPAPAPYGTTEQQPENVLFDFVDIVENISSYPFEPIVAELRFTSYEYNPEYGNAIWSVALFAEGVQLTANAWIIQGDSNGSAGID